MLFFCEECGQRNNIPLTPVLVEGNKFTCQFCKFDTSFPFLDSDDKTTCSTSRTSKISSEPEFLQFDTEGGKKEISQLLTLDLSDMKNPELLVKPFKKFEKLITVDELPAHTYNITLTLPGDPPKKPRYFLGSGLIFCDEKSSSWWTIDLTFGVKPKPVQQVEVPTPELDAFTIDPIPPLPEPGDAKSGSLQETLLKQLVDKNNQMTQMNQTINKFQKELSMTRQIMASQTSGILFINMQRHILFANNVFCSMTGHTPQTLKGKTLDQVVSMEAGWQNLQALLSDIRYKKIWHGKVILKGASKDQLPLAMHLTYNKGGANGAEEGFSCQFPPENPIESLKQEDEITFDALTGIADRPSFQQHLQNCIIQAGNEGHQVGLIYIDLDHFKRINQLFGPGFGDKIICSIVTILKRGIADAENVFVARLGGDEFAIILPQPPNTGLVQKLADKILKQFQKSVENESRSIYISPSIGIAIYPEGGNSPLELLRNADTAMDIAKSHGGNKSVGWTSKMKIQAVENLYLETDLRKAVAKDELMNYYQAQIDLENGSICGMEALARWEHPTQGIISPAAFIPIAENTGLIEKLGVDLVRQACVQGKKWRDMGFKNFVMAANLSGRLLR
ncbi:MAG: diguanylate cyclase, partial [Desulfobulbaceae bacterium]|nr:diguanylate cyclase [Desulfobulbaceae bacterium]